MSNILKKVQLDLSKFKSKYIAPEVLQEMHPKLKVDYKDAVEAYRKTDQYKKVAMWHAKHNMNLAIQQYFNSEAFMKRVHKLIDKHVLKEIDNGNK